MTDATARELSELFPPGIDDRPRTYVQHLWEARHFIRADARASLNASYADLRLGRIWIALEPLLAISIYFVLFGLALRGSGDLEADFLAYLVVGRVSYSTFSRSVQLASASVRKNSALPLDLPRAALPLGKLATSIMRYPYEAAATILVLVARGIQPSWTWILAVALSMLGYALSVGAGLVAARVAAHTPDFGNLLSTFLRFGFYGAGTILPIEVYIRNYNPDALTAYTWLNPTFSLVKLHQWAFFGYEGANLSHALASVVLWTALTVPAGALWFIRGEHNLREAAPRRRRG